MTFTQVYGSILLPFIKNYEGTKNEKGRKAVVSNAAKAIQNSRNLLEEKGDSLPKDLEAVRLYFFLFFIFLPFSNCAYHIFRPSLAISKGVLGRKQMQRLGKMWTAMMRRVMISHQSK
jgi:hypothetical protein